MRRRLGPLFVALLACVWLNQSMSLIAWQKLRQRVLADPATHVIDTVRYPLVFLYRRSGGRSAVPRNRRVTRRCSAP